MVQATRHAMPSLLEQDARESRDLHAGRGIASSLPWVDQTRDEAQFCIVQRGDVTLALHLSPEPAPSRNTDWTAYQGRDFDSAASNGHLVAFGLDLHDGGHGPGSGPDRGAR